MDTDTDNWILIPNATPKKQCAPQPVPGMQRPVGTSLQQPLRKGGKVAPPFVRPTSMTAPTDLPPRQLEPESSPHLQIRHVSEKGNPLMPNFWQLLVEESPANQRSEL